MYTLYAHAGWGSALIETQLAWYGLPFRLEAVGDLFKDKGAGDIAVMTEVAAKTRVVQDACTAAARHRLGGGGSPSDC
jgi:hypothetical protein